MLRHIFIAAVAVFITACASIEHKTPEARQKIKHDLKLEEVVDTSTMSFSWHRIPGRSAALKYTPGIGILTQKSLLLVDYENGKYVQKGMLTTQDVSCISDGNGQTFTVFTKQLAISLIPYLEGPANNPSFRTKVIKLLTDNGQPFLQGESAAFIRKTGGQEYTVSSLQVGANTLPIAVGSDAYETYIPCPSSEHAAQ
ncbi:hypothetical protein [Pseudomonas sp. MYb118]|uniref:hypothetical protein n=1 Tax=Pseudomonas sp. MYb118 TaxID=1848720 RepID=UPI0034CEBC81